MDLRLGHILPSYAMDFAPPSSSPPRWEAALREVVASTRAAYAKAPEDGGEGEGGSVRVVALVDKKAFKASERGMVVAALTDLGVICALTKKEVGRALAAIAEGTTP